MDASARRSDEAFPVTIANSLGRAFGRRSSVNPMDKPKLCFYAGMLAHWSRAGVARGANSGREPAQPLYVPRKAAMSTHSSRFRPYLRWAA